mmetsp:Transcript_37707/g.94491  ORF Transcript_37707/g.94491 Transcript_37707/m.94491 type:complete len:735 (-) Transcript_37707:1564-3768(-)
MERISWGRGICLSLSPQPNSQMQVMKEMEVKPNARTYGTLMDTCAKAAAMDDARKLLEMSREDEIAPNVVIYSALISTIARAAEMRDEKAPQEALDVIAEMKRFGIQPNKYTYASAIEVCSSAAPVVGAKEAFAMTEELLAGMQSDGVQCGQVHYNTLIKGCALAAKQGDSDAVQTAYKTFMRMRVDRIRPNVRTYTAMIDTLAKSGSLENLERTTPLLEEMHRLGIRPTRVTYNVLINAYAMAADAANKAAQDKSRQQISNNKTKRKFHVKSKQNRTVEAGQQQVSAGGAMLEKAISILEQMRTAGVSPDVWTYNTLLNACAKSASTTPGGRQRSVKVLELMREAGLDARPEQYRALLEVCKDRAESGHDKDSYFLGLKVKQMMENRIPTEQSELCEMIGELRGEPECAVNLEGAEDEDGGGNVVQKVVLDAGATWQQSRTLRYVNVMTDEGVVDASKTALLSMSWQNEASREPDDADGGSGMNAESDGASNVEVPLVDAAATASRVRALATLASQESQPEDAPAFDMGMKLLREMISSGLEPDTITYTAVLHAAKQEGTLQAALGCRQLLGCIPFADRNHRTYAVAISALAQTGLISDARDVLDEARSHLEPNIYMYCSILAPLASRPKEYELFMDIYNEMKEEGVTQTLLSKRLLAQVKDRQRQSRRKGGRLGSSKGRSGRVGSNRQGGKAGGGGNRARGGGSHGKIGEGRPPGKKWVVTKESDKNPDSRL